jgi:hypothetical protein
MADQNPDTETNPEDVRQQRPTTREEWEKVPSDPDLKADLGYDLLDLEAHESDDDHVLFLPRDEDMIRDENFLIVRKDSIVNISE